MRHIAFKLMLIAALSCSAMVGALDRRGDWFQVDHDGTLGWVHAGYVTTRGNCP